MQITESNVKYICSPAIANNTITAIITVILSELRIIITYLPVIFSVHDITTISNNYIQS